MTAREVKGAVLALAVYFGVHVAGVLTSHGDPMIEAEAIALAAVVAGILGYFLTRGAGWPRWAIVVLAALGLASLALQADAKGALLAGGDALALAILAATWERNAERRSRSHR